MAVIAEVAPPEKQDTKIQSEAFLSLPYKQQMFVVEYLKDFNGKQAAIRAGYSKKTAEPQASRLLRNVKVSEALSDVVGQVLQGGVADAKELVGRWTSIMRGNIADVVRWSEDGFVFTKNSDEMDRNVSGLVKKIKVSEKKSANGDWTETKTSIELHDPLEASEKLAKYLGIYKGENSEPPIVKVIIERSGANAGAES